MGLLQAEGKVHTRLQRKPMVLPEDREMLGQFQNVRGEVQGGDGEVHKGPMELLLKEVPYLNNNDY